MNVGYMYNYNVIITYIVVYIDTINALENDSFPLKKKKKNHSVHSLALLLPSNLITLFTLWGQFDPSNLNLHNMFIFLYKGLSQLIYVFVDYLSNILS